MTSLGTMQQDFSSAIFSEKEDDILLAQHCMGPISRMRMGIAAYRRNIVANLASAVTATYPLLQNIVGVDFVQEAARVYARVHPSNSGDLNVYGSDFGAFLASYSPAMEYPWLSAVADLEWQIQLISGAKDAPELDFSAFESTPVNHWEALEIELDPGYALIKSNWPLARIWDVNQPGYLGDMRVDFSEAQNVLLHRKGFDTEVSRLTMGELAFLQQLSLGLSLGEALEYAMEIDPSFDFESALQRFIGSSLIRRAHLPEKL